MKISRDYLEEFCNHHMIFNFKEISEENLNKLSYNFGVSKDRLYSIKNIEQLEKTINKHAQVPIEAESDINHEAYLAYKMHLIQNSKINSQSNFIRSYLPGVFRF
jgi:hypothetical protein